MASRQVKFIANVIEAARTGDEKAVKLLRECLIGGANAAPLEDLLTMGECLLKIGAELSWKDEHAN